MMNAVRGPIITATLLAAGLFGIISLREGGMQPGLRFVLTNPHAANALQRQLRSVARRDAVVDELLRALLAKASAAARVRLAIIHNGEIGLTGVGLLRFDVTQGAARQGFAVGTLITNGPLADWSPYLEKLLSGACSSAGLEGMSTPERGQMIELGASERLACPVLDMQGRLLGGVFITWPTGATIPVGNEMAVLSEFTTAIAAQVAAAIVASSERNDM